ncbi:hypothetical protein CYG48_00255 [Neorhizobium sp. SOG26]|uniref:hypothetical protein n=1 Tax=Neorhizobium sp. SOG26 TaxID=2060726 RepID=UPI000E586A90|nr:hypothetical protein [Neorhizobium sp. SOG26]AXV14286.1 hypothetical protein CYG48_00255 [Neorhizobium sp. SOG26]
MPSYHEVRLYLSGLWLLIKGDAQGFRLLDVSDRGMLRSFWAILWCLPAAVASWLWLHELVRASLPQDSRLGGLFFMRTAMLEVFNWMVPLILAGVLSLIAGTQRKFPAVVVTMNWLSVPFSWAYGVMCVIMLLAPALLPLIGLFQLALIMALVISFSRIIRMIHGPKPLTIVAFVLVLMVPNMILTEALQRFLGIYPF